MRHNTFHPIACQNTCLRLLQVPHANHGAGRGDALTGDFIGGGAGTKSLDGSLNPLVSRNWKS